MPTIPGTPIPVAPASLRGDDIAMWLIGVLVFALGLSVLALWRSQTRSNRKCEENSEKLQDALKASQRELLMLHSGVLKEHAQSQQQNTQMLARVAEAIDGNALVLKALCSPHRPAAVEAAEAAITALGAIHARN